MSRVKDNERRQEVMAQTEPKRTGILPRETAPTETISRDAWEEQSSRVWAHSPSYLEDPKPWKCVAAFYYFSDALDYCKQYDNRPDLEGSACRGGRGDPAPTGPGRGPVLASGEGQGVHRDRPLATAAVVLTQR